MSDELETTLILLECCIINNEMPDFLDVYYSEGVINILVATDNYKSYNVSERIKGVFEIIGWEYPEILDNYPVIVNCLTLSELDEFFKMRHYETI